MRRISGLVLAVLLPLPASAQNADNDRVARAGQVLAEILDVPDDIPRDVLNKARCVIVVPSTQKFAAVMGANHAQGVMTCRTGEQFTGRWSAPTMMQLDSDSTGSGIGFRATDFVLLAMNPRSAKAILGGKLRLGADATAAIGPTGHDAKGATDSADFFVYSRTRGLFAGVSLEVSTLQPDNLANERLYGKKATVEEIVRKGAVTPPASASQLLNVLNKSSPGNEGGTKGRSP